jgi:hypothetical protein
LNVAEEMMASRLSDETKGAIVQEVHSQLKPIADRVDKIALNQRSLYRNGSGGPPGYLEIARAEDKEWKDELLKVVDKHTDQLAVMSDFVNTHNQRDREQQERQLKREQLIRRWSPRLWKIGAFLMMSGMSGCVAACHRIEPVIKVLWMDYLKAHPLAEQDLKKISDVQPDPGLQSKEIQQDAGGIMPPHY